MGAWQMAFILRICPLLLLMAPVPLVSAKACHHAGRDIQGLFCEITRLYTRGTVGLYICARANLKGNRPQGRVKKTDGGWWSTGEHSPQTQASVS